jgi:hypothetical protein
MIQALAAEVLRSRAAAARDEAPSGTDARSNAERRQGA